MEVQTKIWVLIWTYTYSIPWIHNITFIKCPSSVADGDVPVRYIILDLYRTRSGAYTKSHSVTIDLNNIT